MSASEFAFMSLGLMLGVATGAALMEVLRSRPPARREVRVTVAADAVPVRRSTLSADPFAAGTDGPAPFGPGDRRNVDRSPTAPEPGPASEAARPDRTPVPSAGRAAIPLTPAGGFVTPTDRPSTTPGPDDRRAPLGIAIRPETNGLYEALRAAEARAALVLGASEARAMDAGDASGVTGDAFGDVARIATATVTAVAAAEADPGRDVQASSLSGTRTGQIETGPCGELRAIAEDRCAVAARARSGATTARDTMRETQRAYDDHVTRAEEAAAIADPRAVQRAKEMAQQVFRSARDAATDRDTLDRAAGAWLEEVNRVNAAAREAAGLAAREHAAADALVTVIERLAVEADAARIAAESAEEACLAARQAVADCQEAVAVAAMEAPAVASSTEPSLGARYPEEVPELASDTLVEAPVDRQARILRLLRGDVEALRRTVAELAGDDADERRRWQLELTRLLEVLTAQAIDAGAIDVDPDHPFWHPFTRSQCRDIVAALASLGYHYDGLGGFADGRAPSQRDLSLAIGYAGLDPMRIRIWPTEAEMPGLYAGVAIAADEYLAGAAGGLTLGELVALLGPRADALTDLWNEWGRVRPRLLASD